MTSAGLRRRVAREAKAAAVGWAFIGPATVVVVGLAAFPAAWAFYISQLKWNGITPARAIGFRNYAELVNDPELMSAIWHTAFYTALFVPTSVILGLLIALALNRKIRFIGVYRTAIFVPFVASAAATGILANYIFDPQFGFANNILRSIGLPAQSFLEDQRQAMIVIAVMSLWAGLGFTVVVYLAALQDIPKDLVEAARVDGANTWQTFRHVILPELTPVTVFTSIWQLIGALQLFDLVYTTTRGGPLGATKTIVYYLWEQAFRQFRYGYGSAVAYVLFALTLVITIVLFVYSRHAKVQAF
ncbi:MAG: sugar ABC transporter permease [Tetrasphaera sp.]|nr:sugar ABC transporter permease [Tetrasphaera sp.]